MFFLGAIISKIISKKTGDLGRSTSGQGDFSSEQQALFQKQAQVEQRQKLLIALGIMILLIIGSILAYKTIQQAQTKPKLS